MKGRDNMYKLGEYRGFEVMRVSADEYRRMDQEVLDALYVTDGGWMYYCGETVGGIDLRYNIVTNFAEDDVERIRRERSKPRVMETAEAHYVEERKPECADSDPATAILKSWRNDIDTVLDALMGKELVERA